jgi:hypothetical protein
MGIFLALIGGAILIDIITNNGGAIKGIINAIKGK